jgi:hypothetical protein
MHITFWQRICLHLWETEFKGDGLIDLAEEILRQHSIQAVAWILLAAFSRFTVRIGSKLQSRRISNVQSGKLKAVDKGGVVVKEISTIKKKPSSLHWDNRKDDLGTSQEFATHWQTPGCKLI